jgi:3-oxoacyl-[acyl-carrier-protein] synthase III
MTGATHTALLSVAGYRPRKVVPNADIIERIDSSDEWIQTRSGIKTRRVAAPDETVPMMSLAAAEKALQRADVRPEQIDCVIVATVSHMLQTPAVATQIADELGATPAAAFDISAACAGYCYGVALASDMVKSGTATYVLVVGVERLTDLTDF